MKICRDLQTVGAWCKKKYGCVTPWNIVLLKLVVIQLVKEAAAFYEIRKFIIVFSLIRQWT